MRDFLSLKQDNISIDLIKLKLDLFYSEELINEIINDVKDPDKIFDDLKLPSCFDCDKCEVTDKCKFFELLKIQKNLEDANIKNIINQNSLSQEFN